MFCFNQDRLSADLLALSALLLVLGPAALEEVLSSEVVGRSMCQVA